LTRLTPAPSSFANTAFTMSSLIKRVLRYKQCCNLQGVLAALWADARGCAVGCQDVTPRLHWHSSFVAFANLIFCTPQNLSKVFARYSMDFTGGVNVGKAG